MQPTRIDPRQFWEEKILRWEENRYRSASNETLLERVASHLSDSLRFRITITGDLLSRFAKGRRVVEVGCGSGLLAERLMAAGAVSYTGYDIAPAAIAAARQRVEPLGYGTSIRFEVGAANDLPHLQADIVFSLGLLDWLSPAEIDALFRASGNADWFHAIAERRNDFSQMVHRLYVYLGYGHRTGSYLPQYFPVSEIIGSAKKYNSAPVYVFRHPRLRFGALLSSLAIVERPEG